MSMSYQASATALACRDELPGVCVCARLPRWAATRLRLR